MESFFRRMSSIVKKGSNKSSDADDIEQENEENHLRRKQQFRQLQQRRRSAPDIRRRVPPTDRLPIESEKKVTSYEHINSQNLTIHSNTINLVRKQYHSSGRSTQHHR